MMANRRGPWHFPLALLLLVGSAACQRCACGAEPAGADQVEALVSLLEFVLEVDEETAAKCLATLRQRVQSGEVRGQRLETLKQQLSGKLQPFLDSPDSPLFAEVALLATAWQNEQALKISLQQIEDQRQTDAARAAAVEAVASARDPRLVDLAERILGSQRSSPELSARLLAALGRYESPRVAQVALGRYAELPAELQPRAIELLTQRAAWSKALLNAIAAGQVSPQALNVTQVGKLLASRDAELAELVRATWGSLRTERNPEREEVIRQMQTLLEQSAGNAQQGRLVFNKVCGQCHRIYGEGQDVGPDITRNGRGSFAQLLSNVFDPSLVIGADYQARTVLTADGRILTGLLAEDSPQRIALKTQGGKLEIIPRDDVEEVAISKLSLMPEGVEKQLQPHELADLFAFLTLDKPPTDPAAVVLAGTPAKLHSRADGGQ